MPLFFQSLDDWKSPVFMYTLAATLGIFGPTPFVLRLTSVIYALAYGLGIFLCLRELGVARRRALWFSLAAVSFPVVYVFGRTAFAEAAPLPFVVSLATWALLRARRVNTWRSWALCGALLALVLYIYSTSRLYAPELCLAAAVSLLGDRRRLRRLLLVSAPVAALGSLPFAWYLLFHSDELNRRYRLVSIFADQPSLGEVIRRLGEGYLAHVSPRFLFVDTGDPCPLHQTGAGFLPRVCAPLLVLGMGLLLLQVRKGAGARFVLLGLLFGPTAVAATTGWPHVTRVYQVLPFVAVACSMALHWLMERYSRARIAIAGVAAFAFAVDLGIFLRTYHGEASYQAAFHYNYDGLHEALVEAHALKTGALFLPPDFFVSYNRSIVEYWGRLDPKRFQKGGLSVFDIWPFTGQEAAPGATILTRAEGLPQNYPGAREVATHFDSTGRPFWRIFRVEGELGSILQ